MLTGAFLKRLRTELPVWVRQGWVPAQYQQSILDHVAQRSGRTPRPLALVLSLMGALLLGAGVISFFAANWGVLPKLAKLALLFVALIGAYAAAGYCLARDRDAIGQGLLLLGVALFGANIFLIAQIYHIDAHYPNGLLVWAGGAVAIAWLGRSQAVLVAAIGLALLWSATETFGFGANPHVWFFLPWLAALVLTFHHRWLTAWRVACWTLLGWCALVLMSGEFMQRAWIDGERTALWQIYLFAGIAFYIVARGLSWSPRWAPLAPPMVTAGAIWAVSALFALGFGDLHRFGLSTDFTPSLSYAWVVATLVLLALVAALMAWRYRDTRLGSLPWYRQGAFVWLVLAGALAAGNLLSAGAWGGWTALGYNLLALAGVLWLVMTGLDRREPRIVNLGFVFFAALLTARYVETFWTLLVRSYFFMVGGLLLLVAGFVLERSRRRLTARIGQDRSRS